MSEKVLWTHVFTSPQLVIANNICLALYFSTIDLDKKNVIKKVTMVVEKADPVISN